MAAIFVRTPDEIDEFLQQAKHTILLQQMVIITECFFDIPNGFDRIQTTYVVFNKSKHSNPLTTGASNTLYYYYILKYTITCLFPAIIYFNNIYFNGVIHLLNCFPT